VTVNIEESGMILCTDPRLIVPTIWNDDYQALILPIYYTHCLLACSNIIG